MIYRIVIDKLSRERVTAELEVPDGTIPVDVLLDRMDRLAGIHGVTATTTPARAMGHRATPATGHPVDAAIGNEFGE